MRKLYLTIITLVTLLCIIFGSLYHIVGFGTKFFGSSIGKEVVDAISEESSSKKLSDKSSMSEFHSIEIDGPVMELTIKAGDDYSLEYGANKAEILPEFSVSDGVLYISQKSVGINTGITINGTTNCDVIVTVPEDVTLESIEVTLDVGNITVKQIAVDSMDLTADVGNVKVKETAFRDLTITADVGDVEVESKTSLDGYKFDLESGVGEIEINGEDYFGDYSSDGNAGSIEITVDVGEIEIED